MNSFRAYAVRRYLAGCVRKISSEIQNICRKWVSPEFLDLIRTFLSTGLFVIGHNAMHQSLLPNHRRINRWIGAIARFALYPTPHQAFGGSGFGRFSPAITSGTTTQSIIGFPEFRGIGCRVAEKHAEPI